MIVSYYCLKKQFDE